MIRVEYRHYIATAHKEGMVIEDWNGKIVYRNPRWNAADRKNPKADLKKEIDEYIAWKPYVATGDPAELLKKADTIEDNQELAEGTCMGVKDDE